MKRLFLLLLLLLLFGCTNSIAETTTTETGNMGFVYHKMYFKGQFFVIDAYLTNNGDKPISPHELVIKVFDGKQTYFEDTITFPEGYELKGNSIEQVTITFPIDSTITYSSINQYQIYYEYH